MAPARKSKPETQVTAPSYLPPALATSSVAKEGDHATMLPLTFGDSNEWGETLIWAGSAEQSTLAKTMTPRAP